MPSIARTHANKNYFDIMNPDIFTWNTTFQISKCLSALRKEAVTIQPKQQSTADFQKTTSLLKQSLTLMWLEIMMNSQGGRGRKEEGGAHPQEASQSLSTILHWMGLQNARPGVGGGQLQEKYRTGRCARCPLRPAACKGQSEPLSSMLTWITVCTGKVRAALNT